MSSNTLLIGALVVGAIFVMQQRASAAQSPSNANSMAATPAGGAPGFGFNLGFFKNG
jgi:hypothetical protein